VFSIKIRIKGYLANKKENTKDNFDTIGIKNGQQIKYLINDTKYKIILSDTQVTLIRENDSFIHKFLFEEKKKTKTNYYIKEYSTEIEVSIITEYIDITESTIEIEYKIEDNAEEYKYFLEMRKELWV